MSPLISRYRNEVISPMTRITYMILIIKMLSKFLQVFLIFLNKEIHSVLVVRFKSSSYKSRPESSKIWRGSISFLTISHTIAYPFKCFKNNSRMKFQNSTVVLYTNLKRLIMFPIF